MPALTLPALPAYIRCVRKKDHMTKSNFGENLKRERELRGVSLEEITTATRIATRFLRAIENENWDQLPGGVFNKGFVRAIARYLGLDEENTVAEYALAVNERPSVPVWTGKPPAVVPDRRWLGLVLVILAILALAGGGWFAARRLLAWRAAKHAASASSANSLNPAGPQTRAPAAGTTDMNLAAPDAGAALSPQPAAASSDSAPADPALLVLKVEAAKKTKLTIEADKDLIFEGSFSKGESHTYSAKDHFDISSRDAGALALELNGKALAPIGPLGKSGKTTLTRDNLSPTAGGGN
jgi:cytoskeletal protein RodZ